MKKFAIGALSVVASVAMAQTGTMESTTTMDSPIKIYANVDGTYTSLNHTGGATGSSSVGGFGLGVGTDAVYLFAPEWGASLGLDFNMINAKKSGVTTKGTYLDIPLNFVYNFSNFGATSVMVGLGPYIGIPLAKWKQTGNTDPLDDGSVKANTAFGLNLETHIDWNVAQDFGLGVHVGFKYEFSDLIKDFDGNQNYWGLGAGLSAKFL